MSSQNSQAFLLFYLNERIIVQAIRINKANRPKYLGQCVTEILQLKL